MFQNIHLFFKKFVLTFQPQDTLCRIKLGNTATGEKYFVEIPLENPQIFAQAISLRVVDFKLPWMSKQPEFSETFYCKIYQLEASSTPIFKLYILSTCVISLPFVLSSTEQAAMNLLKNHKVSKNLDGIDLYDSDIIRLPLVRETFVNEVDGVWKLSAFESDSSILIGVTAYSVTGNSTYNLYDSNTLKKVKEFEILRVRDINRIVAFQSTLYLVSTTSVEDFDKNVVSYNVFSGLIEQSISISNQLNTISVSPSGKFLAIGNMHGELIIIETADFSKNKTISVCEKPFWSTCFHHSENFVYCGDTVGNIWTISMNTFTVIDKQQPHTDYVYQITSSGPYLYTCADDKLFYQFIEPEEKDLSVSIQPKRQIKSVYKTNAGILGFIVHKSVVLLYGRYINPVFFNLNSGHAFAFLLPSHKTIFSDNQIVKLPNSSSISVSALFSQGSLFISTIDGISKYVYQKAQPEDDDTGKQQSKDII